MWGRDAAPEVRAYAKGGDNAREARVGANGPASGVLTRGRLGCDAQVNSDEAPFARSGNRGKASRHGH
jgi:hypothetical protein